MLPRLRRSGFPALAPILLVFVFIATATMIAWSEGAWYDEVFTLVYSRHDLPLRSIIASRWLNDIHPPFFYFLAWLTEPLVGDSVARGRALNIVYLLLPVIMATLGFQRGGRYRHFYLYFIIVLLGCGLSLTMMTEFRSNMLSIALSACVVLRLFEADQRDGGASARHPTDAVVTGLLLIASFLVHYITSIIVGVLVSVFIVYWWLSGRRHQALAWAATAFVAGLPVVAWWVAEHRLTAVVARTFWATTTQDEARWEIERFIRSMMLANVLVAALAAIGTFGQLYRRDLQPQPLRFGMVAGLAGSLALVALFTMNFYTPFIQPRYFCALIPVMAAALAGLASLLAEHLLVTVLVTAVGAITIGSNIRSVDKHPGWERSARIAKAMGAGCADTAVNALPYFDLEKHRFSGLPGERRVMRAGYERAARAVGLKIEPASSLRVSHRCPTLVWVEHEAPTAMSPEALARHAKLPVSATAIATARIWRGRGAVVAGYPADPAG